MMDCDIIRKEYKEKLHSQIENQGHHFETILQFIKIQEKNCNDMEMLRRVVEETNKTKEKITEKNQSLKHTLKVHVQKKESLSEELKDMKSQEQEVIKNQEIMVKQIKNIWKSHMLALSYYKNRLDSNIDCQEDLIIWTFKNLPPENKKKYVVKLVNQDGRWSCIDIVPKLKTADALMETLKKTNDLQGFLSDIRNIQEKC